MVEEVSLLQLITALTKQRFNVKSGLRKKKSDKSNVKKFTQEQVSN